MGDKQTYVISLFLACGKSLELTGTQTVSLDQITVIPVVRSEKPLLCEFMSNSNSLLVWYCICFTPLSEVINHNQNILVATMRLREGTQYAYCHQLARTPHLNWLQWGMITWCWCFTGSTSTTGAAPILYITEMPWPVETLTQFSKCFCFS